MKKLIDKYEKEIGKIKKVILSCETETAKFGLLAEACTYLKVIEDLKAMGG